MSLTITTGSCFKVTGTTAASTKITDEIVYVKSVYWYKPTNAAHLLNLIDKEGGPIITMDGNGLGTGNPTSHQRIVESVFNGIYCDDLDSGTVFIYIR